MSQEESSDGAAVRFPPPLVPVIAIALGWAIHVFVGSLIRNPLDRPVSWAIGAIVIALGVSLIFSAMGRFRESGQDPTPWKSSPSIIASGIYRLTRNPMYLGIVCVQGGIGVASGNLLIVALVPVSLLVLYIIAIRHEERYLTEKFGTAYIEYTQSVRRWI